MNAAEILQLCRAVKAFCPSQKIDQFTPDAWLTILGRYDYADARAVVEELAATPTEPGKATYIEPGNIIGGINRLTAKRIAEAPVVNPPSGLTANEYLEWQRKVRSANGAAVIQHTEPVYASAEIVAAIRALTRQLAIERGNEDQ